MKKYKLTIEDLETGEIVFPDKIYDMTLNLKSDYLPTSIFGTSHAIEICGYPPLNISITAKMDQKDET